MGGWRYAYPPYEPNSLCVGSSARLASGVLRFAPGPFLRVRLLIAEGVFAGVELDAQRCSLQAEDFTEAVFKVAPVGVGNLVQRVAVDDDQRRVASALVGVAQFGAEEAAAWR